MRAIVKEPGGAAHVEEIENLRAAVVRVCGAVRKESLVLLPDDLLLIVDDANWARDNSFLGCSFGGPVVLLGRELVQGTLIAREVPTGVVQKLLGPQGQLEGVRD